MKKIIILATVCALLTGCSDKRPFPSADDKVPGSTTEYPENDRMEYDSQKNTIFGVFMCGDTLLGTDMWCTFELGYKPETELKDGEFLAVSADVTYLSGSEQGYVKEPRIDKLRSETLVSYDNAVRMFSIHELSDKKYSGEIVHYYTNTNGTYIIVRDDDLNIYLDGKRVCNVDYKEIEHLVCNPELIEYLRSGGEIPDDCSDCAELIFGGKPYDSDANDLKDYIFDGISHVENYDSLQSTEYTSDFEQKCLAEGFFAKIYFTEDVDFELFGQNYDADYIIVAADSPDGQAYFSINGEEMKEFPKDYYDIICEQFSLTQSADQ